MLHGQQGQQNLANSAANGRPAAGRASAEASSNQGPSKEPMLAFFGVCIPFGPPSLLEMPSKDSVFKSKHRLDLSIISMDSRGKQLLGLNDLSNLLMGAPSGPSTLAPSATQSSSKSPPEMDLGSPSQAAKCLKLESQASSKTTAGSQAAATPAASSTTSASTTATAAATTTTTTATTTKQHLISAYDLVHHDDLSYMASAHQELLKTGASGLIAYRMIARSDSSPNHYQWLQTSAKLYYKNSKPDFILCTHRPLMEEEGRDLLGKRTMDFKVTYLDVGLSSINDRILACDKFSSLQALGAAGQRQARSPGEQALGAGPPLNGASPALTGDSSAASSFARSLASLSPESVGLNEAAAEQSSRGSATKRRKYAANYDLGGDLSAAYNQVSEPAGAQLDYSQMANTFSSSTTSSTYYEQYYGKRANGDTYYDLDAASQQPADKTKSKRSAAKSSSTATNNSSGSSGSSGSSSSSGGRPAKATKRADPKRRELEERTAAQVAAAAAMQQAQVQDAQLGHLYGHHYQHHQNHQHHLHDASADSSAYPAIQAAAVYAAASLGHHSAAHHHHNHHGHHHHQAPAYTSTVAHHNHQMAYPAAAHPASGAQSAASLYAGASYAHHHEQPHHNHHHNNHHHQILHHGFDSAASSYSQGYAFGAGHQTAQAASSYAHSSGYLPATAEHLLQHYSSARSAALVASWPTSGSDYSQQQQQQQQQHHHHEQHQQPQQHQQQQQQQTMSYATGNWGAAAAAALAASSSQGELGGKRESESYSGEQADQRQQQFLTASQRQYQQQQQTPGGSSSPSAGKTATRYQQLAGKVHGPASLNSDGSAHRSPLSSGDSSNGSAIAAQAALAGADSVASNMISPSAYYQLNSDHHQQQQTAYNYQQEPSVYASQYEATGHYSQQQIHQHYQHQQGQGQSQRQQQLGQQQQAEQQQVAYFQASQVNAAAKLYGANGKLRTAAI